jgi:hypothetical protein
MAQPKILILEICIRIVHRYFPRAHFPTSLHATFINPIVPLSLMELKTRENELPLEPYLQPSPTSNPNSTALTKSSITSLKTSGSSLVIIFTQMALPMAG